MPYTIDLDGKNAVVSGGTRGIGLAISRMLAECGASVTMIYRADDAAADAALENLPGDGHWAVKADIADAEAAEAIAAECAEQAEGGIDLIVLNAALIAGGSFSRTDAAAWRKMVDTNILGQAALLRGLDKHIRPGASIVFISSGAAHEPIEGMTAYGASKAAVNHFAAILAQEWGPRGVRVNVVSPGGTSKTAVDYDNLTEGQKEAIASTALRRLGTTEDVAKAVLFFLSDLSGFVTGQWLRCNGGRV
ncbi:MAG: SDR family NAD(P)-dependent oxidoreductase [Capsulimonadaceae bacterium]|nr:SDR family NAD(P)-dependent oxidoreductase [Capsulimonadaceae bacterium]